MEKIDLLIIEDNPGDSLLIQEYLSDDPFSEYNFKIAEKIAEAETYIKKYNFNAILLDLNLPDSFGLETLQRIVDFKTNAAILVMTGLDDEKVGIEAVKQGAQNYLVKNKVDSTRLQRAIRFSIARKHDQNALQHSYRVLSAIRSVNQLIIRENNIKKLIDKACEIIVKKSGYFHAWIYLNNEIFKMVEFAHSGLEEKAIPFVRDLKAGRYPKCINETNKNTIVKHIDFETCTGCPLQNNNSNKSILVTQIVYKNIIYGFIGVSLPKHYINKDEEISLFNEMVNDIAFALHNIQIQNNEKRLLKEKIESEKELKEKNIEISIQIRKYKSLNKQLKDKNIELIKAKEKAEENERLKSAFLANISHEIRTPMNGILGSAALLQNSNLSKEEHSRFIKIIQKSGERMLNTLDDLIDISRIETGQIELNCTEFNIHKELENLYNFFKPEANKKGLKLIMNCLLPEKEQKIITDLQMFNLIFRNLIKNSIKFTDRGTIEISCEKKSNYILCKIKDTGIGIPENRQKAIFDRFVQADIADTRAFEGAGLGLAISKAYAELLGGKLWFESEENIGSTFYIKIPSESNR